MSQKKLLILDFDKTITMCDFNYYLLNNFNTNIHMIFESKYYFFILKKILTLLSQNYHIYIVTRNLQKLICEFCSRYFAPHVIAGVFGSHDLNEINNPLYSDLDNQKIWAYKKAKIIAKIISASAIQYSDMYFFDDNKYNIYYVKKYNPMVNCILVSSNKTQKYYYMKYTLNKLIGLSYGK